MKAYTDYPLLPNEVETRCQIREVEPLYWDGNKYVTVLFEGNEWTFKGGYLYTEPGRLGEVPQFSFENLPLQMEK